MHQDDNLQVSHMLYLVEDLHESVRKMRDAGFMVSYGSDPKKAYNAFIWFEQGPFIELFRAPKLPALLRGLMKLTGYSRLWIV